MGLLTDPSAGQGILTKALLKHYKKLCALLYIAGILWFCSLAYPPMNLATYFSENALLPGLVRSEFREDNLAKLYHEELLDEMKQYDDSIPYPWLLAKFKQIGLDTYTHNFTLNYPLGKNQKFQGKNVYAVLRAARAASNEALVLSTPYRPPVSVHATTAPSVAIMIAFAKFANKEKYWAKDIIFLITEHEQLGMQAWLEAYHATTCGDDGVLNHGDLRGRAGAIQAAINLEFHDIAIGQVDIKIEGLNGQLPNLDLFNLAAKMLSKEGVPSTFKSRPNKVLWDPVENWWYSFQTLLYMAASQASGIPNGNHGLYHRFGIEALTLEGFKKGTSRAGLLSLGRIIEGVFRSLNNLLERFHQSFFFYLLPSSDRFISIGLYIPAICMIAGALFIKACANWCQLQEKEDETEQKESKKKTKIPAPKLEDIVAKYKQEVANPPTCGETVSFVKILFFFFVAHVFGVTAMSSPVLLTYLGGFYDVTTENAIFYGLLLYSVVLLPLPLFVTFRHHAKTVTVFNIISMLELGTALICVAMNNFSLGLFACLIYVPFALLQGVTNCPFCSTMKKLVWFLVHPFCVFFVTIFAYTFAMFPKEQFDENLARSVVAAKQSVVFSVVDSMIYGNWLFNVVCSVFLSNWLCFWIIAWADRVQDEAKTKAKTD